ncbi:MAG: putative bifunctional diguanylate cyclase/phosphodiesterase [Cyanobium sp.]
MADQGPDNQIALGTQALLAKEPGDRLPLRADIVELLRRAGVEFFRIPIAPEGEEMRRYFSSPAYIHCHFTPDWIAQEGSALTLLQTFLSKVHPDDRAYMGAVAHVLLTSASYSADITSNRFRGISEIGKWCWYEVRMSVRLEGGLRICEGLMINVEEQEESRLKLERVAFVDDLTGLGNLQAALRALQALLLSPKQGRTDQRLNLDGDNQVNVDRIPFPLPPQEPAALIWLDLSGFRRINTLLGRDEGDQLLILTARILRDWIQEGDLVVRPSSDEFLIVLPGRDSEAAYTAALHLQQQLPLRMQSEGSLKRGLTFQAGISSYPQHAQDAETLLSCAAAALDQAFKPSSSGLVIYNSDITETARRALDVEQKLPLALSEGQFRLVFQPQVSAQGELIGCEALLRWTSPDLGPVSPERFIPVAEETGQIHAIGAWVIEEACRQQGLWTEIGLDPPPIGINITAVQLRDDRINVASHLLRCLRRYRLGPGSLHIEITESGALEDDGIRQMEALRDAGIGLHIDDFGTGFASLSTLLRLPIDTLKLDQSFIAQMNTSDASQAILKASVALADSMGAVALAEGVEQVWQARQLIAMGFKHFQGYLFSRPLEAEAYQSLLTDRTSLASWDQHA